MARIATRWMAGFAMLACAGLGAAQDGAAVAIVNGRPITREAYYQTLVDAYGIEILQQMILLDLARQEAEKRGVRVTQGEIDAEFHRLRDEVVRESGMKPDEATEENKQAALDMVLAQRGLTMSEFRLGIERNAHLRKMVDHQIDRIDEQTLREEFARTYGERVHVRHIQIPLRDMERLSQVQTMLQRGRDFEQVARELSVNPETAPRGGELPPFTFDDPDVDPLLREMAFSLTDGEISSAVRTDRYLHILKLVERIRPANVRFEDVRPEVEVKMRERVIPQRMAALAEELFRKADVRVIDGKLRSKWDELGK